MRRRGRNMPRHHIRCVNGRLTTLTVWSTSACCAPDHTRKPRQRRETHTLRPGREAPRPPPTHPTGHTLLSVPSRVLTRWTTRLRAHLRAPFMEPQHKVDNGRVAYFCSSTIITLQDELEPGVPDCEIPTTWLISPDQSGQRPRYRFSVGNVDDGESPNAVGRAIIGASRLFESV